MKLNKIILILIILTRTILPKTFLTSCESTNYYTVYYESDLDDLSINYDDDNDIYEVFIEEEQRLIYIPRSSTEIIICDDNEVVIEEHYSNPKQYFDRAKPVSVKMYFYITIDFEAIGVVKE